MPDNGFDPWITSIVVFWTQEIDWPKTAALIYVLALGALLYVLTIVISYCEGAEQVLKLTDHFDLRPLTLPDSAMKRLLGYEKKWKVPYPDAEPRILFRRYR